MEALGRTRQSDADLRCERVRLRPGTRLELVEVVLSAAGLAAETDWTREEIQTPQCCKGGLKSVKSGIGPAGILSFRRPRAVVFVRDVEEGVRLAVSYVST